LPSNYSGYDQESRSALLATLWKRIQSRPAWPAPARALPGRPAAGPAGPRCIGRGHRAWRDHWCSNAGSQL